MRSSRPCRTGRRLWKQPCDAPRLDRKAATLVSSTTSSILGSTAHGYCSSCPHSQHTGCYPNDSYGALVELGQPSETMPAVNRTPGQCCSGVASLRKQQQIACLTLVNLLATYLDPILDVSMLKQCDCTSQGRHCRVRIRDARMPSLTGLERTPGPPK